MHDSTTHTLVPLPAPGLPVAPARLVQADWLDAARNLAPASVDMLYADIPFNTGTTQRRPPNAGRVEGRTAATDEPAEYDDDFGTPNELVAWLRERIVATLPALKRTANVLIHCDWRTSHRVRVMLDEVLGADQFVNHLIWSYGLGGSSPKRFARKHDDIVYYAIDHEAYWFDPPMIPATSVRLKGQMKKMTDVLDVASINNMAAERTGYPTQKPLELLRILVRACCPLGGLVLDPCCGSGTTLVAAVESGRTAIGIDRSDAAIRTAERRLEAIRGGPNS